MQTANLPKKTYEYNYHKVSYGHYEVSSRYSAGTYYLTNKTFLPGQAGNRKQLSDYITSGHLLKKIKNPLGASIEYTYRDSLVVADKPFEVIQDYVAYKKHIYDYNPVTYATHPIVTSKKINESNGTSYEFRYNPPLESNEPKKSYYKPKRIEGDSKIYFFDSVKISNSLGLSEETYELKNGVVISHKKGVFENKTEWDFDTMLKKSVKKYINGSLQTETYFDSYDSYNNITQMSLFSDGQLITRKNLSYDTKNTLISKNLIHHLKSSTITNAKDNTQKSIFNTYYDTGKLKAHYKGNSSAGNKLSEFSYDSTGRPITETTYIAGKSNQTSYSYQYGNEYIITARQNGKQTRKYYDKNTHALIKAENVNNNTLTHIYDDFGRIITRKFPDGRTESWQYSTDLKRITHTVNGLSSTTILDSMGRISEIDAALDLEDTKTTYLYSNTIAAESLKQNGSWVEKVRYRYDEYNRLTEKNTQHFGRILQSYNDNNKTTTITDPLGRQTKKTYDTLGNLKQSTFIPDGSTTQFRYNGAQINTGVTDARGIQRNNDYNADSQLIKTYFPGQNNSNTKQIELSYYPDGTPNTQTIYNAAGATIETFNSTYDTEGRTTQTLVNGSVKEQYFYDGSGANQKNKVHKVETDDATVKYSYDNMDRSTETKTTIKALNKVQTIKNAYSSTHGGLTQTTFNDGKKINYGYDTLNRVNQLKYDNSAVASFEHNPNGTVKKIIYGNGVAIEYTYTRDTLISNITVKKADATAIYEQGYNYDLLGNITKTTHTDYLKFVSPKTRSYQYTNKNELAKTTVSDGPNYTFSYDKAGNPLQFETPNNYALSQNNIKIDPVFNRITEKQQKDGRKTTFIYDTKGNLSKKSRLDASGNLTSTVNFTYNYQNQLATFTEEGKEKAKFGYNNNRERIWATFNDPMLGDANGTRWYYWNSGKIIAEGHETLGDHTVRYIYNGNEKIAMVRPKDLKDRSKGEEIFYFINNLQGTPVMIVNEAGETVSAINKDEWGNQSTYSYATAAQEEINFTGKKYDRSTRLYYFYQRYYDPEIGRFLTEDPAAQGLNLYAYAGNNPMSRIDPNGEFWLELGSVILQHALSSAATSVIQQLIFTGEVNWDAVAQAAVVGAVNGALGYGGGIIQTGADPSLFQSMGVHMGNQVIGGVTIAAVTGTNYHMTEFNRDLGIGAIKGIHFHRNTLNDPDLANNKGKQVPDGQEKLHEHQIEDNEKAIKKTYGRHEGVEIKNIKTNVSRASSAKNMGTFNFVPYNTSTILKKVISGAGHFATDMVPYYLYGNTVNEGTTMLTRVSGGKIPLYY